MERCSAGTIGQQTPVTAPLNHASQSGTADTTARTVRSRAYRRARRDHRSGLSRRRSRIRVSSLPSSKCLEIRPSTAPRLDLSRTTPEVACHNLCWCTGRRFGQQKVSKRSSGSRGSPRAGRLEAEAGRGPPHVAFSGSSALISSGYGSSLESIAWRSPYHGLRTVSVPYGSFNLATYGGFVVTTSLFTGQVTELQVRDLHHLWTTKVAPAARYVAISDWPR
jgi:hypothetical protein